MTPSQLLLTDDRQSQLTTALANTGIPDPLAQCISEAEADVARYTAGYVIAQESRDGWTRAIALWKAYTAAELGVPDDIQKSYEATIEELKDIAQGKRPNLPRPDITPAPGQGAWGSRRRIS